MGTLVMKKIVVPFLIFLFLFTLGCNNKIETPSENSIPFLTFEVNEKNHNVEAYLNYWDTEKGKIIQMDDVVYTTNKTPYYSDGMPDWSGVVHYAYPLSWDGESYIYLSSQYHKIKNPLNFKIRMFDDVRGAQPKKGVMCDTACSYAKDLQVYLKVRNYLKADYTAFTFTVFDGEKVTEKEFKISLYNDTFHGGIPAGQAYIYDKNKNEVKALHLYYDSVGMGRFLICTINLEKGTYGWHEVTGIEGCIPNMGQMDISTIGNSFYVPICGNEVGIVNLDDYSSEFAIDRDELFRKLSFYLPSTPSHISYPYPGIQGEYKDILILAGMFIFGGKADEEPTFDNFRQVYVAFNTKTSEVMGILEWNLLTPEFFIVRDKNEKELSKIATDKLVKGISKVPSADDRLYKYGHFLNFGFIRFPHKNGD
ncbi:MAG: hypothetical protein COX13_02290 [Caldiserica bacterium CG23_combo_of_CG06-09_8_20_14_all_35_60]|nr:hypothetical protein [Caldisericota bacterium]NCQ52549.1 hypothetical protein [Caldisericota bacterium]PIP49739.1 MAG: hypothetical protein COX13_02290 [Caldiserica bacterium CG23_combo_of_CG06-09_8_20_14_all_35_60]